MILQRPIFKWLVFAGCMALFVAAMAWVTQRMCAMDREQQAAERDAQVQERLRLSLWRMDSMVSALLIRENSRPPSHYQSFHSPTDLYSNRSQQELPKGEAVMPSPLLGDPPEFVQLHFELMPLKGVVQCTSPQVPTGNNWSLANNWYAVSPQIEAAKQRLAKLNQLLHGHPESLSIGKDLEQKADADKAVKQKAQANAPMPAPAQLDTAKQQPMESPQSQANKQEFQQRATITSNTVAKDTLAMNNPPMKKASEGYVTRSRSATPEPSSAPPPADKALKLSADFSRQKAATSTMATAAAPAPAAPAAPPAIPDTPTDLKPQWIDHELLLTRTAILDSISRTQGLWLDWPKLQSRLLEMIHDLLPQAQLMATDGTALDGSSLVTLPVRLLPGSVELAIIEASPLHRSLLIAWTCFIVAAIAVGLVLHRAMLLSERRGAFVSAVTHELRTPLTTFRLYSEMLAEDMVPEGEQRRHYLRTLCDESTRLTHLVENVLAYSRIERGRTAARLERVSITDLLARIEPRLRQRTQQVNLDLQVTQPADVVLNVDALAVEQILFNLVDNACKYAAPACDPRTLHLDVTSTATQVLFRVRDHGPGISRQQQRRLFQPFEKSATEAAHSAPGVGLGLALCRRLSHELGGDLKLERTDKGACFVLTLPRALS